MVNIVEKWEIIKSQVEKFISGYFDVTIKVENTEILGNTVNCMLSNKISLVLNVNDDNEGYILISNNTLGIGNKMFLCSFNEKNSTMLFKHPVSSKFILYYDGFFQGSPEQGFIKFCRDTVKVG